MRIRIDPRSGGGTAEIVSDRPLGSGGQGEVHRVRYKDKEYALKWYTCKSIIQDATFRDNLLKNAEDGSPDASFVWPLFITEVQHDSYGYLMELFPKGYVPMSDILNGYRYAEVRGTREKVPVRFSSLSAQISAARGIVRAFRALQRVGKSYKDLNDGGLVFDTATGDVRICDCDNIAPDNQGISIGKPGYIAPELVTGEGRSNVLSDRHSMAVILFKLFIRADPLEGARVYSCVAMTGSAE